MRLFIEASSVVAVFVVTNNVCLCLGLGIGSGQLQGTVKYLAKSSHLLRSANSDDVVDTDILGKESSSMDVTSKEGKKLTKQEEIMMLLNREPATGEELEQRCIECELEQERLQKEKKTNIGVAVLTFVAAVMSYFWQYFHPMPAVQLLANMQRESAPISVIGSNGKPTVIDFWASWCSNCKAEAPTMKQIEELYGNRVNFIMVNADQGDAWPLIERFGVDAIPHMAMISSSGIVETALIGEIPGAILKADIDALLKEEDPTLPYVMYDAFHDRPEMRKISFTPLPLQ